jgi:hypothetical protein
MISVVIVWITLQYPLPCVDTGVKNMVSSCAQLGQLPEEEHLFRVNRINKVFGQSPMLYLRTMVVYAQRKDAILPR